MAREMQMERRAEYCRACATQAEAKGNENGNLHAEVEGRSSMSTVDARSTTSPTEAGLESYVGYAFARVHGTERADQLCGRRCICGY